MVDVESKSAQTVPIGGQRWTADSSAGSNLGGASRDNWQQGSNNDFLTVLTCAARLYSQPNVHDMKVLAGLAGDLSRAIYGSGALGQVTGTSADIIQPSQRHSNRVHNISVHCAAKQYSDGLWDGYGRAQNDAEARSFIAELKALSHPTVRSSRNIVKILGLDWDIESATGLPKPIIILERAESDLSKFLVQYPSLPFSTKHRLAVDIASGLHALHGCGIIHGDLKPANTLIFGVAGEYQAKLADFSHTLFDTGATESILGTKAYAAPESLVPRATGLLKLADVYSYGMVFATLMAGKELFGQAGVFGSPAQLQRLKEADSLLGYVTQAIYSLDNPNLDDLPAVHEILSLTIQRDLACRHLNKVLEKLSEKILPSGGGDPTSETPHCEPEQKELSIPYHALSRLPRWVHRHVLRVLCSVANDENDPRAAAAAFELAVCHCAGFGLCPDACLDDIQTQADAMKWVVRAAEQGNQNARLAVIPIYDAFHCQLPANMPIEQWLRDMVEQHGSTVALRQLDRLNPSLHEQVLHNYRRTYCGNTHVVFDSRFSVDPDQDPSKPLNDAGDTLLHYIASTGNMTLLDNLKETGISSALLNQKNHHGDTPIIQATRAGHAGMIEDLLDLGADVGMENSSNETVLHFLVNLDDEDVNDIAWRLSQAGAHAQIQTVSRGLGANHFTGLENPGTGSPALRAVYCDNADALAALFEIEDKFALGNKKLQTGRAELLNLTMVAVRFHHMKVLPVLAERMGLDIGGPINIPHFWLEGEPRTLLETCVFGPVSSAPAVGYDYPEKFVRIARFGAGYRKVLSSCLDFLIRRDATIDERGIARFAIAHGRTDATLHLAIRSRNPRRWARLAIQPRQRDMFDALLRAPSSGASDVNYALLYLSMILIRNADKVLLTILLGWLGQTPNRDSIRWVPSSTHEEEELKRMTGFTETTWLCPLLVATARGRGDIIDVLFEMGASLQDTTPSGKTVLQLLLQHRLLDPRRLTDLIQRALAHNSTYIISLADIATLLNTNSDLGPIPQSACIRGEKTLDCLQLGPLVASPSGRSSHSTRGELGALGELWAYIAKAYQCQEQPAPEASDHRGGAQAADCVIYAAMQSNWAAVRCLLDMGFDPNGTGTLRVSVSQGESEDPRRQIRISLPMTPLDIVQWTAYVRDHSCSEDALDLKHSNRAIADLLTRRGGSHSRAYSTAYHLLVLPFVDLIPLGTRHEEEMMNIYGNIFSILLLDGLFIWVAVKVSQTQKDATFYVICVVIVTVNLAIFAIYSLFGERRTAYVKFVYGNSLVAYLMALLDARRLYDRGTRRTLTWWPRWLSWRGHDSGALEPIELLGDGTRWEEEYESIGRLEPNRRSGGRREAGGEPPSEVAEEGGHIESLL